MAHTKSAKKRSRQNTKRRLGNRHRKAAVKTTVRTFEAAVAAGQADQAAGGLREVYKVLDRTAAKGAIHRNVAARRKSRLARRLNRLAVK